jgi:hypothetical protein
VKNASKRAQIRAKTRIRGSSKRSFAKFSANLRAYSRNSLFTLAAKTRNSQQDVSKNREAPDEHLGGKWSFLSEHLAVFGST